MRDMSNKFNLPQSLIDAVKKIQTEETEYQMKVKALMKKKGITSLGQLSPEEKKKFFSQLDSMHQSKNEEVEIDEEKTEYNGKWVASRMRKHSSMKPFADKVEKMASVTPASLDKILPDYISGADIAKLFKEEVEEDSKKKVVDEAFPTVKDALKRMKDAESSKFEKQKTSKGSIYTRKHTEKDADYVPPKPAGRERMTGKGHDNPDHVKKMAQIGVNIKKEEVEDEQLDELQKSTVKSYLKKVNAPTYGSDPTHVGKLKQRMAGISGAHQRISGKKPTTGSMKTQEQVELDEGKSGTGYELYHKDFSSAMAHAYDFAKKKYGIEVDPMEIDRNVAMGPKKPSSGKANAYRLLDKTGKKAIQVQVTNLDNKRYELNMYKEDVDEACWDTHKQEGMKKKGDKMVPNCVPKSEEKVPEFKQGGPELAKKFEKAHKALGVNAKIKIKTVGNVSVNEAEGSGTNVSDAKKSTERAKITMQAAQLKVKHAAEREALRKKRESLKDDVQIEEGFSSSQIEKMRQEYDKIKGIDPSSDNYKKLTAMLDKMDDATLKQVASSKIKFVSGLALNRVNRKKLKEEKTEKKEANGKEKPVKSGEKVSGKKEPITIDPEVKENN